MIFNRFFTGPSQWISIDGFKVPEHRKMLGVLNPELFVLWLTINKIQKFQKKPWVQMNPLNPLLRGPCFRAFRYIQALHIYLLHLSIRLIPHFNHS